MTSLKFWDSIIHGEYMYQNHFTRMPRSEYTLLHFRSESHVYMYSDLFIILIAMIFLTCCCARLEKVRKFQNPMRVPACACEFGHKRRPACEYVELQRFDWHGSQPRMELDFDANDIQ